MIFVNGEDVAASEIDAATGTITITASASVEEFLTECTPTFAVSLGATADPATGVAQDFFNDVVYTVTAHDGTTKKTWTVKTVIAALTGNEVDAFYLDLYEGTQPAGTETEPNVRGQVQMGNDNGLVKIDSENGIITWSMPVLPTWFTPEKLNVYPHVIQISNKATVEPDWNVPQDFTKEVVYTVTAENGDKKTWTVKPPKHYVVEKWGFDYRTYEPSATVASGQEANSIAVVGDYLALSRRDLLINKADGTLAPEKLNITGVGAAQNAASPTAPQAYPFFITSDDAGNMVGATLSAWKADAFTVFKWNKDATAAPEILMVYPTPAGVGFGRKVQVLGDINGTGRIIASKVAGGPAASCDHYVWKIEGGVVDVDNPEIITVNTPVEQYSYQLLTLVGADFTAPYYVGTHGDNKDRHPLLQFGNIDALETVPGPFGPTSPIGSSSGNGFGNIHYLYHKVFTAGGKNMIATLTGAYSPHYCFGIMERGAENAHTTIAAGVIPWDSAANPNTNGTGSMVMEKDGDDILFYLFPTNTGVYCYRLGSL